MVLERHMTGTVVGGILGIRGNGRRVTFGILQVFAFQDGLICREQARVDSGSLVVQTPAAA